MKSAGISKPYNGILFDLDGTLIDHFKTIHRCLNYAEDILDLPLTDYETTVKTVGGSLHITLRKLAGEENFDRAYELFMEHFHSIWKEDLKLIPLVFSSLQKLQKKGYDMAVLTNKQGPLARNALHELQLDPFMKFTLGTRDTPYRKPQKEISEAALSRLGLPKEKVCYIGDGPYDVETAKNAGLDVYLVATGTHSLEEISQFGATAVFANMQELTKTIFNL